MSKGHCAIFNIKIDTTKSFLPPYQSVIESRENDRMTDKMDRQEWAGNQVQVGKRTYSAPVGNSQMRLGKKMILIFRGLLQIQHCGNLF